MANSFWRFTKGIVLNGETTNASDNIEGSLFVNSSDSRIRTYIQASLREVTLNDQSQTLTNKVLSGNTAASLISGSGTLTLNTTGTITVPNATDTLVGKATTDTLTNKTLTGNTAVNLISGSGTMVLNTTGTITLPNATDTLVGKATTDTLTNKTLTGNTAVNLISGAGTLVLNTSGTMTLPNATDTVVGKATTDTLTNKSISGSTNTLTNIPAGTALTGQVPVANGGTALSSGTSGGILGFTASGVIASSAALTVSQLVIGGGAGATPTTLAAGSQFQSLVMGTSAPGYSAVPLNQAAAVSGALPIGNGGTGQTTKAAAFDALSPMTTLGDLIYGGTSGTGTRLGIGSANQVVKVVNGLPAWAAAPVGGVNYISANPDAEVDTAGWATYADAAGTQPVDGTGGSPSSTFTRSTSSPLRGTASFLWTKSANNRQGEGFSYAFTLDSADQGRPIGGSFDFSVATAEGTYASNDMAVYIYDVTNSVLIQPAGFNIPVYKAGSATSVYFSFAAPANSTSYRLIVHTASTSATAYTLKFDNFQLGPQVAVATPGAKPPTIQTFTSGTSQTYTTPANVKYLRVTIVGAGGGGGGSSDGTGDGGNGGNGSSSSFGNLTAGNGNGGQGSGGGAVQGGNAGTNTIGSGWTSIADVQGQKGAGNSLNSLTASFFRPYGAKGGGTPFSAGNISSEAGAAPTVPNSGEGGSGASVSSSGNARTGSGGGGAGYIVAVTSGAVAATYTYTVGTGGTAGSAGTNGNIGAVGSSGRIIVEEFYNDAVLSGPGGNGNPTVQVLAGSGTYTTPANVKYIKVTMCGAGGAGSGSGTASAGNGGAGSAATFGSSLLTAGGANGGGFTSQDGGNGGTNTINSPAITLVNVAGANGGGSQFSNASGAQFFGGTGGTNPLGGAGAGGGYSAAGRNGQPGTGAGGGGGGTNATSNSYSGSAGGAGGYLVALITNPLATYAYSVPASITGASSGSNGFAGGNSGSGAIIVEEFYAAAASTPIGVNAPTKQVFTSSSGTYTAPANVKWLKVRLIGGGGGGGGGGTASSGNNGGTGGNTTFGTSLLTGNGGVGGQEGNQLGGSGGTASVTTSSTVLQLAALTGGSGSSGQSDGATTGKLCGGSGCGSPFGGGGGGGNPAGGAGGPGQAAPSNTGSGGGGAGNQNANAFPGSGGGAGGYVESIITAPNATYAYAVGAAGTAGAAGTGGTTGGAGGSGLIIVEEYYI